MPPKKRCLDRLDNDSKAIKKARNCSKKNSKETTDCNFSLKKCNMLFLKYSSSDNSDSIGPEGIEQFCMDLGVQPENIVMLVLAWYMDAQQMGYFSMNEWRKGLEAIKCDSIPKIKNKLGFLYSALTIHTNFKNIFRYAFDFSRDKDQRSLDVQTACDMLQLLLEDKWAHLHYFREFIQQSKYKVINKDQWYNILEFSRCISPDLSNYDEDGAWPVLLDEFVEWLKQIQFKQASK